MCGKLIKNWKKEQRFCELFPQNPMPCQVKNQQFKCSVVFQFGIWNRTKVISGEKTGEI